MKTIDNLSGLSTRVFRISFVLLKNHYAQRGDAVKVVAAGKIFSQDAIYISNEATVRTFNCVFVDQSMLIIFLDDAASIWNIYYRSGELRGVRMAT
jgi:hypothetical protein